MAEIRQLCFETTHSIRGQGDAALEEAARALSSVWLSGATESPSVLVGNDLTRIAAEHANALSNALNDLAKELYSTLQSASEALGYRDLPGLDDLAVVIKEMPKLDLGTLHIDIRPGLLAKISLRLLVRQTHKSLRSQIGQQVEQAFSSLGSMLDSWERRTLGELQLRFETHADQYRAHLNRISAHSRAPSGGDQAAISRDLTSLGEADTEERVQMAPVP